MADKQETIGERIKRVRQEKGLSQRDIASPDNRVTYAYISRVENNMRNPSIRVIRILALKLGVTPTYLETGTNVCPHCGSRLSE